MIPFSFSPRRGPMLKPLPIRRAGMTLVELLVVVAIIGLLAVTVLPNMASTTENRRSREAARVTSTFFAKAQSRAIGRPEWAGVTIVPTNANVLHAIDLVQANVPQVYRGETFGSKAWINGWNPLTRSLGFNDAPPLARKIANGDLIRFDGSGPWSELGVSAGPTPSYSLRFRGSVGGSASAVELATQNSRNTPWPTQNSDTNNPQDVPHTFEVLRQPVRNGMPFTIPDSRCIDMSWSGFGGSPGAVGLKTYHTFVGEDFNRDRTLDIGEDLDGDGSLDMLASVETSILFDSTGRVRQILWGTNRTTVTGPVYLLVGRVDRAANDPMFKSTYDGNDDAKGFNWQYGDSYWIAIDPASGIIKTAECLPGQADVIASQKLIRSEMPAGGK